MAYRRGVQRGDGAIRTVRSNLLLVVLVVVAMLASACSLSDALTLEDPNDTRPESQRNGADEDESDDGAEGEGADDDEFPGGQLEEDVFPNNPGPGQGFQVPGPHPALAELPGQLAVTDGADVVVVRPNGTERRIVDGASLREVVANQPVWSPSGALLAWTAVGRDQQSVMVLEASQAEPLVSDAPGSPVYYLQWKPNDLGLVFLRNGETGGVEAGTLSPGDPVVPFSNGQPFFVSWGPNSDLLAAHVGNARGEPGTLSLFEPVLGGSSTPLLSETAPFGPPAWLNETSLLAVNDEGLVRIDIETREQTVLVGLTSPVQFVVSPDGARVAYRGRDADSTSPDPPPLRVLDLATGESVVVLETDALAWEWSPDSQRLAVLTTAATLAGGGVSQIGVPAQQDEEQTGRFQWAFWASDGPSGTFYGATPAHEPSSIEATSYLPFFEQYAQSHHRWSPDSSAFAFAGSLTAPDGETFSGIYVQIAEDPSTFSYIGDGEHVTWSTSGLAAGISPA